MVTTTLTSTEARDRRELEVATYSGPLERGERSASDVISVRGSAKVITAAAI